LRVATIESTSTFFGKEGFSDSQFFCESLYLLHSTLCRIAVTGTGARVDISFAYLRHKFALVVGTATGDVSRVASHDMHHSDGVHVIMFLYFLQELPAIKSE
jgi:hypothetical protein